MKKLLLAVSLLLIAAVIVWGVLRRSAPPRVNFVKVKRTELVSALATNGKVEPYEWQALRAETAGILSRVAVREGQTVASGTVLGEVTDPSLQADIGTAEAKLAEARAGVDALEAGGKPAELTDIENNLARARFDLQGQQNEYNSLRRLAEKQAATSVEVRSAHDRVEQSQMEIAGLEKRRTALVARTDVAVAQARLRDAENALKLARQRAAQGVLRAPISGEIYGLTVRPGAYLNPGDLVANIGRMDRLRVRVYVDEPELGRVNEGQAVTMTWQALPGREWHGTVERKPASVVPQGSRQVGEVVCIIENPGRELVPGTNVDAVIRTAVVSGALVVPKEALRHDAQGDYTFLITGETVARRAVKTGISSATQVQIADGLAEGDAVALPSDTPVHPGDRVTAVM